MTTTAMTIGKAEAGAQRQSYFLTGGLALPTSDLLYGQSFLGSPTLAAGGFQHMDAASQIKAQTGEPLGDLSILLNFRINGSYNMGRLFGSDDASNGQIRTFKATAPTSFAGVAGKAFAFLFTDTDIPVDTWHRLVITARQDGTSARLAAFINGTLIVESSFSTTLSHSSVNIRLFEWSGEFENASVREAVISRSALTDTQCLLWSAAPSDGAIT